MQGEVLKTPAEVSGSFRAERSRRERPRRSALREDLEELGVEPTAGDEVYKSVYEYEHGAFEIIAIKTTLKSSNFKPSSHDKIEFVKKSDSLTLSSCLQTSQLQKR